MAASTISLAPPARAQIGNIFSDPAPRPPGAIPRGNQQQPPPPDDDEEVPELPRGRLLPTPNRPPPGQGVPAPGSVQSQPLAPPPGTTVVPQNTQPGIAVQPPQPGGPAGPAVANTPPGANPLPPGQRQPKACRNRRRPCSPATRWSPSRRRTKIINKKASFSGLDKITGRIINFDEDIGETVQFGALRVKTDACYTRPVDGSRQHRRLCRGRRDHAAGRGEADFLRLDVRGEPRPARRRASDLRYLADRLQSARTRPSSARSPIRRNRRRRRPRRSARRRRSRPHRVRRRSRNSSSSRSSRQHRRRSSGRADCSAGCSGIRQSVFERKPVPDLIRGGRRFA